MYYENTSDSTAYFNLTYPSNNTEITIGNFSERVVSDILGIEGQTETHNISFVFKPGYQFRYAPGPGESSNWVNHSVSCTNGMPSGEGYNQNTYCWESFDNLWSWNFNLTVENKGENWAGEEDEDGIDRYKTWVRDEFGVYSYTEICSAGNAAIFGAPGERHSTNGSSWYNRKFEGGESQNITVKTRSNGNYSMTVNVSDLKHIAVLNGDVPETEDLLLDNDTIWVRGGNRTTSLNFSDDGRGVVWLYGYGSGLGDSINSWQSHEVNGTSKYTGEAVLSEGPADKSEQYPDFYTSENYNGHNPISHTIEFACEIPAGQIAGKYSTHVYYRLRTQTHQ